MGIIFGKKTPTSRVTPQDKAVLQLKQQRDKLKQYQKRIELSLIKDRELAKKLLGQGQRDRAKLLLRKKRFQESVLTKTDAQLENLDKLSHDIEFAQIEMRVIDGLKQGNEALKKLNESLKIEDIERILDETREGAEKQAEISALLGGELSSEDEEAVEDELAALLSEEMPEVPVERPQIEENEEEEAKIATKEKRQKERVAVEAS